MVCAGALPDETVCGEAPDTSLVVAKALGAVQLALVKNLNDTVPTRAPPAVAETVTESLGTQVWALVSDDGTLVTDTSSAVSVQRALCVTPLVFGKLSLQTATWW